MTLIKFILLFFISLSLGAQNIDSLSKVYNNKSQPDSLRLDAIDNLAWEYRNNNPDTAIILAQQQLQLAKQANIKRYQANAHLTIGTAYKNKGNYPNTLQNYLQALTIRETMHDTQGIAACFINMGNVYTKQNNYTKALEYQFKALQIFQQVNNKRGMSYCYGNIGTAYGAQGNYPKALEYMLKGLSIYKQLNDVRGQGICYGNIGNVYTSMLNYTQALQNYTRALQIRRNLTDKNGIAICYVNIASLYNKINKYSLAISYSDSAIKLTKQLGDIDNQRLVYQNLAQAYAQTNNYKKAYEAHVLFKQLTDSIFNTENSKQLGDIKTKFEVEKKEAELKIKSTAEQEKLKAISAEEKKRQQIIIVSVIGLLLVVLAFSLFLYKRFKITERQKTVIEKQKQQVDAAYDMLHEKNKEVMDSIRYAKRIQNALITSEKYIHQSLNKLNPNK